MVKNMDPCFGYPVQTAARWVALAQLAMTLIMLVQCVIFVCLLSEGGSEVKILQNGNKTFNATFLEGDKEKNPSRGRSSATYIGIWVFLLLWFLAAGSFHYFGLYKGVQQRLVERVRLWWRVMFVAALFTLAATLFVGLRAWMSMASWESIVDLVLDLYSLWVVHLYLQFLGESGRENNASHFLDNPV